MRLLNWDNFDNCIHAITLSCKKNQFTGVYGMPRGGLCMAVALSHSLRTPLLNELKPGCLVVDDVYETGATLNKVSEIPGVTTFVWISKLTPVWWNAVETTISNEWLVFPWESREYAEEDMMAYQLANNQTHG